MAQNRNRQNRSDRQNRMRDIVSPMDRRRINREARARTQLEFAPTQRAIQGDLRASRQQSRNINSWYGQYQRDMRALRAGQESALSAGQDRLRQDAAFLGEQGADRNTAVGADQDRSAAIRGAVADPSQNAAESAAEKQRQALMASMRTRTDQIGQASNARLSGVNAAAELGRQADQRQERNTRLESRAKMRDLARDRGAARVKNIGDLTRAERDFYIQRRTLNNDIRNDRERLALDRRTENRLASQGSGGSGGSGGGGGGSRGISPAKLRQPTSWLRSHVREKGGRAGWMDVQNRQQYYVDYLINRNVSPRVARAAVRRYIKRNTNRVTSNTPNSSGAGQPGANTG